MDVQPADQQKELSLRDLILKLREFIREVIRYWMIPAVCGLMLMGYMAYKYFKYVPVYPATITFNVDEDEGGNSSGLGGLLGQFGFAGARPTRFNLDKILALSKSRRVIQLSLFTKTVVNGKEDFLANHIIREYHLETVQDKKGASSTPFTFTRDSLELFSKEENIMLLRLYGLIIGPKDDAKKALVKTDYNEDTNIMSLTAQTTDESLSLELSRHMFNALSKYYIDKSIEKLLKTYKLVVIKKDSVLGVLRSAEYGLAHFKDSNRNLLFRTDEITQLRLQRDIIAMTTLYGEVLKNAEMADFGLKNKTPFVQIIDTPISPIPPANLSLIKQLLKGFALGFVIGSLFVVGRKVFRAVMNPA